MKLDHLTNQTPIGQETAMVCFTCNSSDIHRDGLCVRCFTRVCWEASPRFWISDANRRSAANRARDTAAAMEPLNDFARGVRSIWLDVARTLDDTNPYADVDAKYRAYRIAK